MPIEKLKHSRYNEEKTKGGVLLNVLVACEESQEVCKAFRSYFDVHAFSCDVVPCSGGHPDWHIQEDVKRLINGNCSFHTMTGQEYVLVGKWDLIIAFPPCTYMTKAGARHMYKSPGVINEERFNKAMDAKRFFMCFYNADCSHVAIENPTPLKCIELPTPSQIVQPYYFGDPYSKRTLLWLRGLPPLTSSDYIENHVPWVPSNTSNHAKGGGGSSGRAPRGNGEIARSKTFPGIAKAMAAQWIQYIRKEGN